jgi:hypothetical protein
MQVQGEYPRTEDDPKVQFKAMSGWVSSRWKAMSDAEKAVRAIFL